MKIGGDFACFSRPEFKTERVSYPVITPSAARGALEAVFWKPEIRWEVHRIDVLRPVREASILRNELGSKQSPRSTGLVVEEHRQQRTSRILRDVAYTVHADMVLHAHATEPLAKYLDMFERRVERGQFHHAPYLGTREFSAWFEPATPADQPCLEVDLDIGTMLFDIAFVPDAKRRQLEFRAHGSGGTSTVGGFTRAMFFHARVSGGTMLVPPELHRRKAELEGRPC